MSYFNHETAVIEDGAQIGEGSKIWHFTHVRNSAVIGKNVSIARDGYVDANVHIGDNSRVQNGVSIYNGVKVGDWCFIGPHVIFTNDQFPRVGTKTWDITPTLIKNASSIGAGAIIRCGIEVGEFSMIGAGAIVTKSVKPFSLVLGTPGKKVAYICACGKTQMPLDKKPKEYILECCNENMETEILDYAKVVIKTLKNT